MQFIPGPGPRSLSLALAAGRPMAAAVVAALLAGSLDSERARVEAEIAEVEARLSALRVRRSRLAPARLAPGECPMPPPAPNVSARPDASQLPPWCPSERQPPPALSLEQISLMRRHQPGGEKVPVLPSLLVPCCAHSGTTFMWRCLHYAMHPDKVCSHAPGPSTARRDVLRSADYDAPYASNWTVASCAGRKYLLPGLTGNIHGHWDYRKEWFFYGGGGGLWNKGWSDYVGIDLPICYWEKQFQVRRQLRKLAGANRTA